MAAHDGQGRDVPATDVRDRAASTRRSGPVAVALAVVLLAAALLAAGPDRASGLTRVSDQRVGILGYFWDLGSWTRVFGSGTSTSVVVLNPDSGVGTQQYEHWVDVRARARQAGEKAVGYVYTNNGARSASAVMAEVQKYLTWYDVDGIFLDSTPGDCGSGSTYVSGLVTQIRTAKPGAYVVESPSSPTAVGECHASLVDLLVNFRGSDADYQAWSVPSWVGNYPATRFWHQVYAVSSSRVPVVVEQTKQRNAGVVEITDDALPNPWDVVPDGSYWSDALTAVRETPYVPQTYNRPGATDQRFGVPAFFTTDQWGPMLQSGTDTAYVIINPANGPGSAARTDLQSRRNAARTAGQKVIGYISSNYAGRSPADVATDVQHYLDWYDVDGIFVDQVTADCGTSGYYADLAAAARTKKPGLLVVLNPGVNLGECYIAFADAVVNFEGRATTYETWSPSLWVDKYPASRFWHLVYSTPDFLLEHVVTLAKQRRAGVFYATTDDLPNPWDSFPGSDYWDHQRLLVRGSVAPPPPTSSGDYVAVTPARLLDTRVTSGEATGAVGPGGTVNLRVVGSGGVPASGVAAVVLNVTAVDPTADTFVTVYPGGEARPLASNLNTRTGVTSPNLVIVKVGADGTVNFFNNAGSTHLVVDVQGWIPTTSSYRALSPSRLLDTRDGTGGRLGALGPSGTFALKVTGVGGVPSSGVGAVVLNLTAVDPTADTYATVYPGGQSLPLASNVNTRAGVTRPNLVIARVGNDGTVNIFNFAGNTHFVADVSGWLPTGSGYTSLTPARLLDTRDGTGGRLGALGPGQTFGLKVTGVGGVPSSGVGAVVLNVTAVDPTASTFVTAYPGGEALPLASNLNTAAGVTTPNLVIAKVGVGGVVNLYNANGDTHLVVDVQGWYAA